jgi:ribosome-associated protein
MNSSVQIRVKIEFRNYTRSINLTILKTAHKLVDSLAEKKGENILLMDIQEISSFTDYFIICSGTSDRMLNALSDTVAETAKKEYKLPARVEGAPKNGWVVVDCGDIVIHLFSAAQREYYNLESLWEQGKTLVKLQ